MGKLTQNGLVSRRNVGPREQNSRESERRERRRGRPGSRSVLAALSVEQRWPFHLWVTCLCALQEEKERKEQEEQRKKLDEDAKKKKVLSNMTQQYGAAQKVRTDS